MNGFIMRTDNADAHRWNYVFFADIKIEAEKITANKLDKRVDLALR